jgi:hypothetical protein
MRICYHPTGDTLTRAQINAWIAAALAGIDTVSPGVLITVQNPEFPYAVEQSTVADDRVTLGGIGYSRIRYRAKGGVLKFAYVNDTEVTSLWRPWYAATDGGRVPFVIDLPLAEGLLAVRAPGPFPLQREKPAFWSGGLTLAEHLL